MCCIVQIISPDVVFTGLSKKKYVQSTIYMLGSDILRREHEILQKAFV